jgi:outer membrane lipoprotein carrier protein
MKRLGLVLSATIATIAISAVVGTGAAQAQDDLLDRAVAAWANVKTARATFEQTITNALTGRTLTTTGEYQQERPNKLSVSFSDSAHDRVVADGKFVWLYLPSSAPGQVIKTPLGADGTGTVDISAQFLSSPRTRYNITPLAALVVSGRPTHGYTLVPKTKEGASFKTASVWIDDADASIRQFEVIDANDVQRKVRLISLRTNVPVDASAFVFTPPAGVRVVAH